MEQSSQFRVLDEPDDLAYARAQYRVVRRPNPELPAPAYWDRAGNAYVPYDYETQEADFERFCARANAEMRRRGVAYDGRWLNEAWTLYWDGMYGICLKRATPENIVAKNAAIDRIAALLEKVEERDGWHRALMAAVDELDAMERPFCGFDRRYFGRPVSRDTYVDAVRRRYSTSAARRSPRAELPT
jgi:hypothetical protein